MELIIKNIAIDLLAQLGIADATVAVTREPDAEKVERYRINIVSDANPLLIGYRGENLRAFQHVFKLIIGKKASEFGRQATAQIDVDGYRQRQAEEAVELALRRAELVANGGNAAKLPPMSSYLRRAIHTEIAEKFPDLTTDSVGTGPSRAIVIRRK